jgi:hypothetical protein
VQKSSLLKEELCKCFNLLEKSHKFFALAKTSESVSICYLYKVVYVLEMVGSDNQEETCHLADFEEH